jgi:A/G-specific adenine glycosylase
LALGKATSTSVGDIEDLCNICEPFGEVETDVGAEEATQSVPSTLVPIRNGKTTKQATLASFAFTRDVASKPAPPKRKLEPSIDMDKVANHAKKFPLKVAKKAVREEETLVCAIRRNDGEYLMHRRPEKGLLAGLWEFPSLILGGDEATTATKRTQLARSHVLKVLEEDGQSDPSLLYRGELGSVPWLFSHLKLTMHVHLFTTDGEDGGIGPRVAAKTSRWTEDVEGENMGTGMRKCWALVQDVKE